MRIAIVGAGFKPGEADRLAPRHGDVQARRHDRTIPRQVHQGHDGARLRRRIRRRLLEADRRLRQLRLSGKPRGELRQSGLCLGLDQMPLPRCVRGRAAQQPADGLLCAGAARARRAGARRRGAAGRCESFGLGLHAGSCAGARAASASPPCVDAAATSGRQHALRLGLRQISGFSEEWGKKIESVRGRGLRFRPRSLAAHAACRRRRWRSSRMPMPSVRSASTAAMRSGR